VKRPWRNPGWYSTEFDSISDDKHKASARIDEVFVNERPLRWVPAREQLEPGSFFWSAGGEGDPAGGTCACGSLRRAFDGNVRPAAMESPWVISSMQVNPSS
jgi:hypothetical protein